MSGSELPAGLVERCTALARAIADVPKDSVLGQSGYASEARAIVALLAKPVDPDLVEARTMESDASEANGFIDYALEVRRGEHDDDGPVRCRYEGILRGRLLESRRKVGL